MATGDPTETRLSDMLTWYTSRAPHHVWDRFTPADKERMLADDLEAGKRVSMLLTALVGAGLLLSIVTVLAVILLQ